MKLPRFTLRDLFWLVLVCALAVGWWREHNLSSELPQLRREKSRIERELSETYDALARAENDVRLTFDERYEHAKDNEEEWRDRYNAMMDAIEAKGYTAYWEHHSRTVELEQRKP